MCDFSLLIGNGINNITNGNSWLDVLNSLGHAYGINIDIQKKPFPLAYEEIYFNIINKQVSGFSESEIKYYIALKINSIKPNEIHKKILELECNNILTTNYDLAFEYCLDDSVRPEDLKNEGKIKESKYNIFRHHKVKNKNIWHIHGALNNPHSIILGYEHYSGYLQSMRGYTTTGSQYSDKTFNEPFTKRLKKGDIGNSWIDDFFTKNIYILGLNLDFVEIDLWWLLTFRERSRLTKKINLQHGITYYIPHCYYDDPVSKPKIDLLKSVGVIVNHEFGLVFKGNEKEYYLAVINDIHSKTRR
ncbi:SIR2 family protein [Dickeya sp. NCPPB 3274]|uniref:SIR2 family protein n=1 Tax=Dickeya sp. NCPPB 3274 TaxID=568766 RepID=UPI0003A2859E|nr:SIR2 family protein [Dickeya sp. NCPPB 3274]